MRCSDRRQPISVVIGASLAAGAGSFGSSVQSFEQKETKRTKGVCNFVSFVSFCRIAGVLFSDSPGFLFVRSEYWVGTFPGAWIGWPSRVQAGESVEFAENVTLSPMVTTDIRCSCGAAIQEFEPSGDDPFYSSRLPNHCPECHRQVNYAILPVTIRDGWTGVESKAVGGTAYRFAIVVDCGKCWPDGEADVVAEFLGVIERTVQIKTRVFRDFY